MIKSLSLLVISALAITAFSKTSLADQFDERASAKAQAEAQRQDQEQYARDIKEIADGNRDMLKRVQSLAHSHGGTAKNLRCYEGGNYRGFTPAVGDPSDYTWQIIDGVPVGTVIQHYTTGNVIGAIAMSPFTIGSALHGSSSDDDAPTVHHSYPDSIGRCRFQVGNKLCSITKYNDGDGNDDGTDSECL